MRRAAPERHGVGVERRSEMVHFGTHIGDLHDRISAELALDPDVPLLNVRILAVSGIIDHVYVCRIVDIDAVYGRRKSSGRVEPVVVPQRPLTAQGDSIAARICAPQGSGRAGPKIGSTVEIRVIAQLIANAAPI